MPVIYKITCKTNNKVYIGKTENTFETRYPDGRFWAATHNRELQDDAYNFGPQNMEVQILLESLSIRGKELEDLEQYFINKYRTFVPYGYNKKFYDPIRNRAETHPGSGPSQPPLEKKFSTPNIQELTGPIKVHHTNVTIDWESHSSTYEDEDLWYYANKERGEIKYNDLVIGDISILDIKIWKITNERGDLGHDFFWLMDEHSEDYYDFHVAFIDPDTGDFREEMHDTINSALELAGKDHYLDEITNVLLIEDLTLKNEFKGHDIEVLAVNMAVLKYQTPSTLVCIRPISSEEEDILSSMGFIEYFPSEKNPNFFFLISLAKELKLDSELEKSMQANFEAEHKL